MKIKVFIADQFNPHFNLATENYLFNAFELDSHILFLWQNDNTVVIGRHQNPLKECDLKAMKEDKIILARRPTGGGAVFHDIQNINFSFISPLSSYDKNRNNKIIVNALKTFGVDAQPTGRNDICVDGKKISGSAFKETKDRALHHGTLMINVDLKKLAKYLTPDVKKLQSKAVTSVVSRVTNLKDLVPDISRELLFNALIDSFSKEYNLIPTVEKLSYSKNIPEELDATYKLYSSSDWLYDKTPNFTHILEERFSFGNLELHFNVKMGKIEELKIFSDALDTDLIDKLQVSLIGYDYIQNSSQIFEEIKKAFPCS